jgi:hypothetical protein
MGLDEAVTGADGGDPLSARDSPGDDITAESMCVHDVRTQLPAKSANRAPLTVIVPVANVDRESADTNRFQRGDEWVRLVRRRKRRCDGYRVTTADVSRRKCLDDTLKPAKRSRCDDM